MDITNGTGPTRKYMMEGPNGINRHRYQKIQDKR